LPCFTEWVIEIGIFADLFLFSSILAGKLVLSWRSWELAQAKSRFICYNNNVESTA